MISPKINVGNRFSAFLIGGIFSFLPFMSAPLALTLGFGFGVLFAKDNYSQLGQLSGTLLKVSVILLGFGMNWSQLVTSSIEGFRITAFSVVITLVLGVILGKIIKAEKKTTWLIAAGTAICGGSAIATVSPIIKARNEQFSYALIVVFVLNAFALVLFPFIGQNLGLTPEVFGNWAAIAIHDTSSVVGAGEAFGGDALQIATTVKLTRALWIIPIAAFLVFIDFEKDWKRVKIPWFIAFFIMAILLTKLLPDFKNVFEILDSAGRKGMLLTLFLIGVSIKINDFRKAGVKPFLLGVSLWLIVSIVGLVAVEQIFE